MKKIIRSALVFAVIACGAIQFSALAKAEGSAIPISDHGSSKSDHNQQTKGKAHDVTYPDIWARTFDGPEDVVDMFFSDEAIWGNEPVLILKNSETGREAAVGFFSGKRRAIYTVYTEKRWTGCREILNYHHFYANTKREMVRRYMPSQDLCSGHVKMDDGEKLKNVSDAILECSWIDAPLDGMLPQNFKKQGQRGEGCDCEPISDHLVRVNKDKNIVWAKTFVRFYPDHETAPDQNNDRCLSEKIRLESESGIVLALPDETLLVLAPDAVIRIRDQDGSTPFSTSTLRVLNSSEVIKTKLELVHEGDEKVQECRDLGNTTKGALIACLSQAAEKKCYEFTKSMKKHSDCSLYGSQSMNMEQQQVNLAKRLFEK